jgi:hypothetical protein
MSSNGTRKTNFKEKFGAVLQLIALLSFVGLLAADALIPTFNPWRWAIVGLLFMAWGAKPETFGALLSGIRIVREDREGHGEE